MVEQVVRVAKAVEEQLDDQIARFDNLDDDDVEKLRERRLRQYKLQAEKKKQWAALGHGEYQEITVEKDFFALVKQSERVVAHFYRENSPCKVVDKHLNVLAKQHMETRFIKLNAEKSPFLTERLKIFMLPALALVRNGKVEDSVAWRSCTVLAQLNPTSDEGHQMDASNASDLLTSAAILERECEQTSNCASLVDLVGLDLMSLEITDMNLDIVS